MERRGLNIRKGVLKRILPFIRWLPLTTASGVLSGFGKLEYRLHRPLRTAFLEAVGKAQARPSTATGTCRRSARSWPATRSSGGPATCSSTASPTSDADEMFSVSGREHLDAAHREGQGLHGPHQPLRRPHAAGPLAVPAELPAARSTWNGPATSRASCPRRFTSDGPISQDKLFISRKGESTDAASSILRATRVLKAGMLLFLAGDVRWSGQMTEQADFLGRSLRFSTTWVVLASMTAAPAHQGPHHRDHGRGQGPRCLAAGPPAAGMRHGGRRRRYPAEHRPGRHQRLHRGTGHRRRRLHAHHGRPGRLRGRRVRAAPRRGLRPGRAALGAGRRAGRPGHRHRHHRGLLRVPHRDQAQGRRRRRGVDGRAGPGARHRRAHRASPSPSAASTSRWSSGTRSSSAQRCSATPRRSRS